MPVADEGSWDLLPRISEILVAEYRDDLLSAPSYRIGPGETVPEAYVRLIASALFVDALYRLVPETTRDLAGDEAREIVAQVSGAFGTYLMPPHDRQPLDEAERRQDRYIDAWQHRYQLRDAWLHTAAELTMRRAYDLHHHGKAGDGPLVLPGAAAIANLGDDPVHLLSDNPARLDGLISFNPRTETVDAAMKRLMPDLECRLREHLTAIAADDRARNDARMPKVYRTTTAFEWVVRYQVRGESRNEIACADRCDRGHVSKSVNETADAIGLALRQQTGGRPNPHTPPRTIRVG